MGTRPNDICIHILTSFPSCNQIFVIYPHTHPQLHTCEYIHMYILMYIKNLFLYSNKPLTPTIFSIYMAPHSNLALESSIEMNGYKMRCQGRGCMGRERAERIRNLFNNFWILFSGFIFVSYTLFSLYYIKYMCMSIYMYICMFTACIIIHTYTYIHISSCVGMSIPTHAYRPRIYF